MEQAQIHLVPFKREESIYLVNEEGNELFRTFAGDEQDLAKLLASDPHWTLMENFHDTFIVFNTATLKYVVIYPDRKVAGKEMSNKDLITITRIVSSFTGIGFYLDVE